MNPYERLPCGHLARWAVDNSDGSHFCLACDHKAQQAEIERLRNTLAYKEITQRETEEEAAKYQLALSEILSIAQREL